MVDAGGGGSIVACCSPHMAALVRYALATGCRASEIAGLEWDRVDLSRNTAWLNQTKNGTPRGVPLNVDAVQVSREQLGKHPRFCFTRQGEPIRWQLSNTGWHAALRRAGIKDFRFHDLRHTWASWHRQAGTSCDELKDLGAGSRGRWSTAMPSSLQRTCWSRRLGSRQGVTQKCSKWHAFVTARNDKGPALTCEASSFLVGPE